MLLKTQHSRLIDRAQGFAGMLGLELLHHIIVMLMCRSECRSN